MFAICFFVAMVLDAYFFCGHGDWFYFFPTVMVLVACTFPVLCVGVVAVCLLMYVFIVLYLRSVWVLSFRCQSPRVFVSAVAAAVCLLCCSWRRV